MYNNLSFISLVCGFIGCFCVIGSFLSQLYDIYKRKDASGTSWGLIIMQMLTCILFSLSAGINIYLGGIINLPFLLANIILLFLFIIMVYLKIKYKQTNLII